MESNFRVVIRAVFLVGFCWFLLFAVSTTIQENLVVSSSANFGSFKSKGGTRNAGLGLNYVSKRRVPNGPDPIHNRYANNSSFMCYYLNRSIQV